MNQYTTLLPALVMMLSLAACSSGGNTIGDTANENGEVADTEIQTGGGAGDTQIGDNDIDADPQAVALLRPFTGIYTLPGNWAGVPASEAYLNIQAPDITGVAPVLLNRVNAVNVCIERTLSQGKAIKDPFSQRVFLNELFDFENSVLSLTDSGNTLIITLSEDVNDIDNDKNTMEFAVIQAERFAADLPDTCE